MGFRSLSLESKSLRINQRYGHINPSITYLYDNLSTDTDKHYLTKGLARIRCSIFKKTMARNFEYSFLISTIVSYWTIVTCLRARSPSFHVADRAQGLGIE